MHLIINNSPGNSRVPTVVLRRRPATARSSSSSSKKHGAPNSRERGTKTNNKSTTRVQNYIAWSGNSMSVTPIHHHHHRLLLLLLLLPNQQDE
mmetsp:Transcript_41655/g.69570  ORF Transcript_41655/g.69570 Transcript_41655/m.69570 type:complete len:93 (+) Transcript_41655:124-402(+)